MYPDQKGGYPLTKSLSQRMLEYRAKHNMSQEDFAIKANVCLMTVNAVETGKRTPTRLTQTKIEMILQEDEPNEIQG